MNVERIGEPLGVPRMDPVEPLVGNVSDLAVLVPEEFRPAGGVGDAIRAQIPIPQPIGRLLNPECVPLLPLLDVPHAPRALDGVAQRPRDTALVDLVLHEVILRAPLQAPHPDIVVVESGEDDDGDPRPAVAQLFQGVEPTGVGEGEVQQHDVGLVVAQILDRVGEPDDVAHGEPRAVVDLQMLGDEPGVAGIVFDEQDRDWGRIGHDRRHLQTGKGPRQPTRGGQVREDRETPGAIPWPGSGSGHIITGCPPEPTEHDGASCLAGRG